MQNKGGTAKFLIHSSLARHTFLLQFQSEHGRPLHGAWEGECWDTSEEQGRRAGAQGFGLCPAAGCLSSLGTSQSMKSLQKGCVT